MQSIQRCVQRVVSQNLFSANKLLALQRIPSVSSNFFATYDPEEIESGHEMRKCTKFVNLNKVIFPPQKPGEPRRPAYVCNVRENIRYSPKKMWYIASFVRGMSVDEAVKQLSFVHKKGAAIIKEVILETQKMAVQDHNVEYESNLWVAESFATKGMTLKGTRRSAKCRINVIKHRYCHYFVRLEEGKPPENYYGREPRTGEYLLEKWMKQMRSRKISNSL